MDEQYEEMKKNMKNFEEELSKQTTPGDREKVLANQFTKTKEDLINHFEDEFDRKISRLSGYEKAKKEAEKTTKIQEIQDNEAEQEKKDQMVAQINDETSATKYAERAKEREIDIILFIRHLKLEKENDRLEESKTARASEPVLYRSRGPNSYSASKQHKSANTHQSEADPKPWNAWQVEKSKFLLSASRSIGMLRTSKRSAGFRFDAFQAVRYFKNGTSNAHVLHVKCILVINFPMVTVYRNAARHVQPVREVPEAQRDRRGVPDSQRAQHSARGDGRARRLRDLHGSGAGGEVRRALRVGAREARASRLEAERHPATTTSRRTGTTTVPLTKRHPAANASAAAAACGVLREARRPAVVGLLELRSGRLRLLQAGRGEAG